MQSTAAKSIHIQYFALLREQRGIGSETLNTEAATARELYNQLRDKHGFSLGQDRLSVAINNEFSAWDETLKSGDTVVFIPPVAGG